MLLELYIFYEIVVIGLFLASFFTKQEVLWAVTIVLAGILMFTAYSIEQYVYEFNPLQGAYVPMFTSQNYPYLMGINSIFFSLGLIFGIFDLFDKYQWKMPFRIKGRGS